MNNNSDEVFNAYENLDFSSAKTVAHTPILAKLQAQHGNKTRITMRVDTNTLAIFKARAEMTGGNYQTLMNEALQQFAQGQTMAKMVQNTIRQSLAEHAA